MGNDIRKGALAYFTKVLVEGLRRAGKDLNRASLHRALSAMTKIDVGGVMVHFKDGFRHGGLYVDIAFIRRNGELRT